jgi:hypothetical protein
MLDKDNAKLLEARILERLEQLFKNDGVHKEAAKASVPAIIIALQEYERLSYECRNQE